MSPRSLSMGTCTERGLVHRILIACDWSCACRSPVFNVIHSLWTDWLILRIHRSWICTKFVEDESTADQALHFLLDHPRRFVPLRASRVLRLFNVAYALVDASSTCSRRTLPGMIHVLYFCSQFLSDLLILLLETRFLALALITFT